MERDTLSPEPQILIQLESSHSKTWTQRLVFSDALFSEETDKLPPLLYEQSVASVLSSHQHLRSIRVMMTALSQLALFAQDMCVKELMFKLNNT